MAWALQDLLTMNNLPQGYVRSVPNMGSVELSRDTFRWGMGRNLVIVLVLVLTGCTSISNDVCVTGRVCPSGLVCSKTGEACAPENQVAPCLPLQELDPCSFEGAAGICRKGLCEPIRCGNGEVEGDEECDDGNANDEDACHNDCTALFGTCGDGIVNPDTEECDCGDSMAMMPANCASPNSDDAGQCTSQCTFHCGNGLKNHAEDCEPGLMYDTDCLGYGADAGQLGCTDICTFDRNSCALMDWVDTRLQALFVGKGVRQTALWLSQAPRPYNAAGHGPNGLLIGHSDGLVVYDDGTLFPGGPAAALMQDIGVPVNGVWGFEVVAPERFLASAYVVGDDGVLGVYDSADPLGWDVIDLGTTEHLFAIWGIQNAQAPSWVVGGNGTSWRRLGSGAWQAEATGTTSALRAVHGRSDADVIAVGDAGVALRWTGSAWAEIATGATDVLRGVWMAANGEAFAVGDAGTVLHWAAGSWVREDVGGIENLRAVWGLSPSDVYAAGDNGAVYHRGLDGVWRRQTSGTTEPISALAGGDNVPVTYSAGHRLRMTWGFSHSGAAVDVGVAMRDVESLPNGHMVAVGDAGTIYYFDRRQWTPLSAPTVADLRSVWPIADDEFVVAGGGGAVLRYKAGVWTDESVPDAVELNAVWADSSQVWAAGDAGVVYGRVGGVWARDTNVGASEDLYTIVCANNGPGQCILQVSGTGNRVWFLNDGSSDDVLNSPPGDTVTVRDRKAIDGFDVWVGSALPFNGYFADTNSFGSSFNLQPGSLTSFLNVPELYALAPVPVSGVPDGVVGGMVAVGDGGRLILMANAGWGRIKTRTTARIRGVAYADGLVAYVAEDGTIDSFELPGAR